MRISWHLGALAIVLTVSCAEDPVPLHIAVCGNGEVEGNEPCDDGNRANTDGCNNDCERALCGDGVTRNDLSPDDEGYEACDDGNDDHDDGCTNSCAIAVCGDGVIRQDVSEGGLAFEQCDDGNRDDTDGCLNACLTARCGDGVTRADLGPEDEGYEACDDGNAIDTDACLSSCVRASCGDGFVGPGEGCDDGNDDPTDDCTDCQPATCGDGVVQDGEACDDGNAIDTDACLSTCVAAACGDGVLWADNEACDDGNQDLEVCAYGLERCTVCDPTCQEVAGATAYCGDGEVFGDVEVCDDGNTIDGDGCSGDCATACETPDPESFTSGQYGGSTYAISRAQVSWQDAQAQCRSFCGHLIAVNDRAEYGFYQGLMSRADAGGVWIGLTPTDQNRQHTWSNGDPLTFTYYCDYPNGNGCANPPHPPVPGQCTTSSQYWYPEPCTNRRQFLCELP